MRNISRKSKSYFANEILISNYNVYSIAFIGCIGHPLYWIWWSYFDPKDYENLPIRIIGVISCFILFTKKYWSKSLKKYFSAYYFFAITYNFPFFFTVYLINSDFSTVWTAGALGMIYTSIMIIPRYLQFFSSLILGTSLAFLYCYLSNSDVISFDKDYVIYIYLPVFAFAITTGLAYSRINIRGAIAQERSKILESLGGSIAHEMCNPLGSVYQSSYIILERLKQVSKSKEGSQIIIPKKELEEIQDLLESISNSSTRGNMVIDMILSNIKGKKVDRSKFKIYKISDVINSSIKEFAFDSDSEKAKVSVNIEHDFYFKGDKSMFVFVIFNLLKNALFYLKTYPDSRITISTKKDPVNKECNHLYFKDSGPGIPKDQLESIFESFVTSGKEEGTGLGLPFCRRVIHSFDGKISCNSQLKEYTEFVISIPLLSEEDEQKKKLLEVEKKKPDASKLIKKEYVDKTILLADDQLINRKISTSRLERLGFKMLTAEHGKHALEILNDKGDEIDLILMDLQMPEIDGYETAKLIHSGFRNKEGDKFVNFNNYKIIPIVAYTGDNDDETIEKIKNHNMGGYIGKSWNNDELLKVLKKVFNS